MKNWAIVHTLSGAIVAITSVKAFEHRDGLEVIAAPLGVTSADHWWTGTDFAARETASIELPVAFGEAGEILPVARPAGSWVALTDGTISDAGSVTVLGGYKQNRFTLVGRYRGEAVVDVIAPSGAAAMATVRAERNRRLALSDKYVLPDFPIGEVNRTLWLEYRAALRELPEAQPHATLGSVAWPSAPTGGGA